MRWTVGRKVVATLLIVVIGAVVAAWTALQLAADANDATTAIHRDEVQGFVTLAETVEAANEIRRRGLLHVLARSAGAKRELESEMEPYVAEVERNLDRLEVNWAGQQSKLALLAEAREEWARYLADRGRTLRLSNTGDFDRARDATTGATSQSFQELAATFSELIDINEQRAAAHVTSAREEFSDGRARVIFVISLATLLGLVLTLIVVRRLTTDIGRIATAARGLAAGDLAQRAEVSGKDELQDMAEGFNSMADRLEQMVEEERESRSSLQTAVAAYSQFAAQLAAGDLTVRVSADGTGDLDSLTRHLNGMAEALADISREVRTSAHDVGASAAEILATVNQHTTSATEQSAAVAETTATIDEVRATAEQVAEKAKEVADQSQNSVQASSEAAESVDAIVSGMSEIKTRVDAIAQQILELSEQTQRIGEITDTVNDLADQSNLLALNATIEAAKAGEHGKGFAVVADEVRNLADQSKEAASQVRSILGEIRKGTDGAVMTTEEGARVVERGAGLAANAGGYIDQLADVIRGGADAAQQITASAHQQRIGMDQISHAMADINQATTQFVAGARQSQQAASDLHELAARLQAMTERYKV